ncbi:MAG: DUF5615 family PIN-like protein [Myxococcota bacterium]
MALKFLVAECCALSLVDQANEHGFESYHVAHRGPAGSTDADLCNFMLDEDLALVTNNAGDFRKLLGDRDLHPGLVIIRPNVSPRRQRELFRKVLDWIAAKEVSDPRRSPKTGQ